MYLIIFISILILIGLAILWSRQIGVIRGGLSALLRLCWCLPIFLALFPKITLKPIPSNISLPPLHILIDDSDSMKQNIMGSKSPLQISNQFIKQVKEKCNLLGCKPKIEFLSNLNSRTLKGYTPLSDVLEPWLLKIPPSESWVLVTDGGDEKPSVNWSVKLKRLGLFNSSNKSKRGALIGFIDSHANNIWIDSIDAPPFAFESKSMIINVLIKRSNKTPDNTRVQLQVAADGSFLTTVNAEFTADDLETYVAVPIPFLSKGEHIINFKTLPVGDEKVFWDNEKHIQIEVMANTIGVLHLLGAPNWDGRFLRRYLKSEPKYDLISFYILRDPWDTQVVSERELSLIPFPVDRLFTEELKNFRVLILQNFALFQFLQQEYQNNLVEFVKKGGGLLFIGGLRALQSGDLASSALSTILPFNVKRLQKNIDRYPFNSLFNRMPIKTGPYFDKSREFKLEFNDIDMGKRELANIYDDWQAIKEELTTEDSFIGLHNMQNVSFKNNSSAILLNAIIKGTGKKVPAIVASYPGKGRALWIFTDSLWRLAMDPKGSISRQIYNQFFSSAMNWLLRKEIKKPLIAKNLSLRKSGSSMIRWEVDLIGPAARYFNQSPKWVINLCGKNIDMQDIISERIAENQWHLSGSNHLNIKDGQLCKFDLRGYHVSFGSLHTIISEPIPKTLADDKVPSSLYKINQLAEITKADLFLIKDPSTIDKALFWIESNITSTKTTMPPKYSSTKNYYWILTKWWLWLLLLAMPAEIIIRKWHLIISR